MKPLRAIDHVLNGITIYRQILYALSTLITIGIAFSFMGVLSTSGTGLLLSVALLVPICYGTGKLLGKLYGASPNAESSLITALILVCIMPPITTLEKAGLVALAGLIAIASKYILAINHKHVFNPAALAAVAVGYTGLGFATWWIGSPEMLPFTLLVGFMTARKNRHFQLIAGFLLAALATMLLLGLLRGDAAWPIIKTAFTSWPLIFFATIMLTEPSTLPPVRYRQLIYAALVGILFSAQISSDWFSTTPEMALLIGNLYAFAVSPRYHLRLKLVSKTKLTPTSWDFAFQPDRKPSFKPGQYAAWTLPHRHMDARGNRRTFTIASSPTEPLVHLGAKFYAPPSSFKRALLALKPGDSIVAGQIAGDFTLPDDPHTKLLWIAGGIGITPFTAQAQFLLATKQQRDITLLYLISSPDEQAYYEVFTAAKTIGLRTEYVLSGKALARRQGMAGPLTAADLRRSIPDIAERHVFISGPSGMVEAYNDHVKSAGVPQRHIITDHFTGY